MLGEGRVGRIFVNGPSVMPGYYLQEEETRAVLDRGWARHGRPGLLAQGASWSSPAAPRISSSSTAANIWPQDIEWGQVEARPCLRRGDACAFSVDTAAGERVVVLVQSSSATGRTRRPDRRREADREETAGVECRIELVSATDRPAAHFLGQAQPFSSRAKAIPAARLTPLRSNGRHFQKLRQLSTPNSPTGAPQGARPKN